MSRLMLIVVMVACVGLFSIPVFGQTNTEIPSWVKGVANYWVEDKINDGEFAEALEFLIDSNIIQLGNTVVVSEQEISWEEKYNTLLEEKNSVDTEHKSQIDKMMQEHSDVYLEMGQKLVDRNNLFDEHEKEWRESYNKVSEENDELKAKIKELEK